MICLIRNILLLVIFISFTTFSQRIEKIEVNKNKTFSDEEIEEWAGLNEGQNYFPFYNPVFLILLVVVF